MPIYCDESGFTGNNMLNEEQPYFSYVGVNLSAKEAEEIVNLFKQKYNIQMKELKGQALLAKGNKYKDAVDELFNSLLPNTKITVSLKKYSLACSFFEYIFEPVIAAKNSLFYESKFHKYISNIIYMYLHVKNETIQELLEGFENFMRNKGYNIIALADDKTYHIVPHVGHIIKFASIHRDKIVEEFQGLGAAQKWILDNSMALLYHILCAWTTEIGNLTVICDKSKPLIENAHVFENFINRKDQFLRKMNGKEYPLIPHLSKSISFKDSHDNPGLQLADIMASTVTYSLKNMHTCQYADKWCAMSLPHTEIAIVPDFDFLSTSSQVFWKNFYILEEIIRRSEQSGDLLNGIEDEFDLADKFAQDYVQELAENGKI